MIKWTPLLLQGFALNIAMSFLAMAIGTAVGVPLGLAQISLLPPVRFSSWFATQFFRNSPWLVLLFYCMLLLPFELSIGGTIVPAARLAQIHHRAVAAGDGQRLGAGARRGALDPVRPVGGRRVARDVAAPDAEHDHPAAMREAHDAALDEPLRDPHRRDAAHLRGRRQRGDDPDRRHPLVRGAHRAAGADVSLPAAVLLPLLLSDRARDARARTALRGECEMA